MMNIYDNEKKLGGIANNKKALLFIMKRRGDTLICETKKFTGVRTVGKIKLPVNVAVSVDFEIIQGGGETYFNQKQAGLHSP